MIKTRVFLLAGCLSVAFSVAGQGAESFKPYPGSKLDAKSSQEASGPTADCQVYTTPDGYDKIYSFYKGLYKEFVMPSTPHGRKQTLPSGKELQMAFFILDGEKDLAHSKSWLKIQYPFVGKAAGTELQDIRDEGVIQMVHKK